MAKNSGNAGVNVPGGLQPKSVGGSMPQNTAVGSGSRPGGSRPGGSRTTIELASSKDPKTLDRDTSGLRK